MVVNHADLMRTNPGFRELTRAGVPQKRGTNLYRTVYMYIYHDSVLNFITYFFAFRLDHIMDEYCSIQFYMDLRAFCPFSLSSWSGQKLQKCTEVFWIKILNLLWPFSILVVGVISAVTATFGLLKGIADNVDFSRVCVIGFKNLGNRKLINPTWYLSHGVIRDPLPRYLPAGEAGIFTFEKSACK